MSLKPLSLKCEDCGAFLRSVKEAQQHGDATGHSNFSESTETVKNLVCEDCGKPCRSDTERDLHTKRTGHNDFVDKTDEAGAINTEEEMRQASKPPEPEKEVEMVPVEVDEKLLGELKEMGFPTNRAKRALHFSGSDSVEGAVNWIVEHDSDPDIDEALMVPKGSNKAPLSEEEARQKAEELRRRARERREQDEKEAELQREKMRLQMGREMAAARRAEEEQQLQRNIQAREAEKREAEMAMAKVKAQLEEDRRERRRRLGLPEELTEEEKKREAEKAAAKVKNTRMGIAVRPVSAIEKLRGILVDMKKSNGEERAKVAWQTLLKYVGNVVKSPDEDKFRTIRLSNEAFVKRVGSVTGGVEFLQGCGFERSGPDGEFLTLRREDVDTVLLSAAGEELNSALVNPFFGAL